MWEIVTQFVFKQINKSYYSNTPPPTCRPLDAGVIILFMFELPFVHLPIGCGFAGGCSWPVPDCPSSWLTSWLGRELASEATARTWVARVDQRVASIRCTPHHSYPRTHRRTCSSPVLLPENDTRVFKYRVVVVIIVRSHNAQYDAYIVLLLF